MLEKTGTVGCGATGPKTTKGSLGAVTEGRCRDVKGEREKSTGREWDTTESGLEGETRSGSESPKCVYMCVKRCPSQTPNAFICVSPNAFICVSPNAFICVSPNAFICVSPNVSADATELASLAYLCSLRSHVFLTV